MWPIVRQARHLGRYREIAQILVGHGFGFLIEQLGLQPLLSLPRRAVMRVPAAPPLGSAARLREALIALGPTFVKLGQALSTRPDLLPADFVQELERLQDTVPPFPAEQAVMLIEESLGSSIDELFARFDRTPLAAASLGQVHAATLHDGTEVVVKVQRPDIAGRIYTDLDILADAAGLAQERLTIGSKYNLVELVWEFSATLRAELDYRREARNTERFARMFADNPNVYVPQIYWDYTDTRILTIERLFGIKLGDSAAIADANVDRPALARNTMQIILQEIFSFGYFHSDPHPGNFFVLPGDVLGIVDFGQVGSLDRPMTQGLLLLLNALAERDSNQTLRAIERLGLLARRDITPLLRRDMQRFIDGYVDRSLQEMSARETINELLILLNRHEIRLNGPVAMLLKALIMMEGLGLQLDPKLDVFSIARPYAQQALTEQFSPTSIAAQAFDEARELGKASLEIPHQVGDLLQQLTDGELRIQTREQEMQRLAAALVSVANRLTLALVLSALIIGVGMVGIAMGIGGWTGILPTTLLIVGFLAASLVAFGLGIALLRGRE
jgi:ubiquinone biosynthesis protein